MYHDGYDIFENRCVCCGEIIPEGRQVCPNCERKADQKVIIDLEPVDETPKADKKRRFLSLITENIILLLIVWLLTSFLWQGLELVFYGEIRSSAEDSIIGLIYIACIISAYYKGRHDQKF